MRAPTDERIRQVRMMRTWGLVCVCLWIAAYVALSITWPEPFRHAWQPLIGQWTAGQAFAASHGMYLELPKWYIVAQGTYQGVTLLLFLYPLLVLGHGNIQRFPFVSRVVTRTWRRAHRFKARFGRYGEALLLIFLMCPLWNTGPLAVGVVGYFFSIRFRVLLAAVIAGNAISLSVWVWFFEGFTLLLQRLGIDDLPLPMPVLVLIAIVVFASVTRAFRAVRAQLSRKPESAKASAIRTNPDPAAE